MLATDLKPGAVFKMDKDTFIVLKYDHIAMGRGGAVIKVRVKNLKTLSIVDKSFSNNDKFDDADVSKSNYQFIYSEDSIGYFMDIESFEQVSVDIGDDIKYLKNGEKVIGMSIDGKLVSVDIPKIVELTVKDTEEGVKGNSSSNPTKPAELETGLIIQVPLFVKQGEVVRVNTENGEYVGRESK